MYLFQYSTIRHAIAFGIGAAIGVIYCMSVVTAYADSVPNVSIAGNGQAMVKGARVTAITTDSITAVTEWGSTNIPWTIEITGNTRFTPEFEHQTLREMVQVGETIGFNGTIDHKTHPLTVYATSVRNESVLQAGTVLDGTLLAAVENGFVIQTDDGTSTVRIGTGTIMTKEGNRTTPHDLTPGDTIKAFGTLNVRSRVLDAERLASQSLPLVPNTGTEHKPGLFATLIAWLRQSGRVITLR
jgi:hypothetical protein